MIKINFDSLRDDEFEQLCTDILEYKLGKSFRYYKRGKDQGIDIKSLEEESVIFGQAKNYVNTSYSKLKSDLKNKELSKVININPKRYILCVGQELIRNKILEICDIFSPYLKEDDVYDATILKKILNEKKAKSILEKWDKIWISPEVVETIYNRFKEAKYNYTKDEILEENNLFVETSAYRKANRILNKENIILIHGEPGVGKTTIARQLCIKYIREDYELVYGNASDLKEIESNICNDRRMIILIDDFLGSNYLDKNDNIIDNALDNIIRIVKKSKNKKLILTTRTYIYNNAKAIFERFYFCSENMDKLLVDVKDYTNKDKANMLYNHLEYNNLLWSQEYLALIHNEFYKQIIYHRNFNPRLISLIAIRIKKLELKDIKKYILEMLENPSEIWTYEYNKLKKEEKIFLNIVALFGEEKKDSVILEEYNRVLKEFNINLDDTEYDNVIKSLSVEFITISVKHNKRYFDVSNHSIVDYILNKFINRELSLIKYLSNPQNIDLLYKSFFAFKYKDKQLCKQVVDILDINLEQLIQNRYNTRYYIFNVIYEMLSFELTEERIKKIDVLLELCFVYSIDDGIHFIVEILQDRNANEKLYDKALKLFKENIVDKEYGFYNIRMNGVDSVNDFLSICYKFTNKRKNQSFMLKIMEHLIDILIECMTDEVQTRIDEMQDYLLKDFKEGKSLEDVPYELLDEIFEEELPILKQLYTKKYYDYILNTVRANQEAFVDEETLLEYDEEFDDEIQEDYMDYNSYIVNLFEGRKIKAEDYFDNNKKDKLLVFLKGIKNNELKNQILEITEKEHFLNYFFETPEGIIELVDFVNVSNKVYKDELKFYKAYLDYKFKSLNSIEIDKVKIAAYNAFCKGENKLEDLEWNYNLQKKLVDIGIAYSDDKSKDVCFKNIKIHIYLALDEIYSKKENILDILDNHIFLERENNIFSDYKHEIIRLYSKFDMTYFNTFYIYNTLKVLCSEIGKNNRYIEQYINIWNPYIYVFDKECVLCFVGKIFDCILIYLNLFPIDLFNNIEYNQYYKMAKKIHKEGCEEIKIKDLYKNQETRKYFKDYGLVNDFKENYNNLLKVIKMIEEDPSVDLYNYF